MQQIEIHNMTTEKSKMILNIVNNEKYLHINYREIVIFSA